MGACFCIEDAVNRELSQTVDLYATEKRRPPLHASANSDDFGEQDDVQLNQREATSADNAEQLKVLEGALEKGVEEIKLKEVSQKDSGDVQGKE
jgi:hypothetical protein